MSRYDEAIADYTQAVNLDPKDADAYTDRAWAYDDKGRYDEAIADFTEALRLDLERWRRLQQPGRMPTKAKGYLWYEAGRIADYTEAVRLDPGHICSWPTSIVGPSLHWTRAATTRLSPTSPKPSGPTPRTQQTHQPGRMPTCDKGRYDEAIADFTEAIRLRSRQLPRRPQ